ncbi:MAG: hypothetical protein NTV16_01445 [Actinobacteria bacterium]|nr:hypothetical protein [Actinomycetota bacterium]
MFIGGPSSSFIISKIAPYIKYTFLVLASLISIALLVLSIKERLEILFKIFLILTGATALGLFGGFFLGFLYYISKYFGYFYNGLLMVCPVAFLVGVVGSIVLFIKRRRLV